MIVTYLADVGDGLAGVIITLSGKVIQIDCGTQQDPRLALTKGLIRIHPDVFLLSHFHVDHYNGFFAWRSIPRHPFATIDQVYFPRIPEFPSRERFVCCLFAISQRVMGDITGSMEADFLNILSRINRNRFAYRSLAEGDNFIVDGSTFSVLWPPRLIDDKATLKIIDHGISAFDQARKEDELTRQIYKTIEDKGVINPYLHDDEQAADGSNRSPNNEQLLFQRKEGELPEVVKKANESLRAAANHLSLAFMEDNRLLFLGDLESHEIKKVVRTLKQRESLRFQVLITPHHGTHWQRDLTQIRCIWAVSSVGPKLFKKSSPEYKKIADRCCVTYLLGDVELPFPFACWYPPRRFRYWYPFP
jgi:hypothetical protein